MGRALVAGLVLLTWTRVASAEKVRIESDPAGAELFLNTLDNPQGRTPRELDLKSGSYTVILRMEGYEDLYEEVNFRGNNRTFRGTLLAITGFVIVEDVAAPGAQVFVDGKRKGEVPFRAEMPVGTHQVRVMAPGYEPYETSIEVEANAEAKVEVSLTKRVIDGSTGGGTAMGAARPLIAVGAGYQERFRRFTWKEPVGLNYSTPYRPNRIPVVRGWAEVAPHRAFAGAKALWPLSLVVSGGIGIPFETKDCIRDGDGNVSCFEPYDTAVRSLEVSARWSQPVAESLGVDLEAGYAREIFAFRRTENGIPNTGPGPNDGLGDVDYVGLRFGVRAVAQVSIAQIWLGGEGRLIFGTRNYISRSDEDDNPADGDQSFFGPMPDAKASGFGGSGGVMAPIYGPVSGRLELSYLRFSWSGGGDPPGGTYGASGATDATFAVAASVGYQY